MPGWVFISLVLLLDVLEVDCAPEKCCDFASMNTPSPCYEGDEYGANGCPTDGSVCKLNEVQVIKDVEYGTCECGDTLDGLAVNKSSPKCCYQGTMGHECELCNGAPPPPGLEALPLPANSTRCFPPNQCNTSILSHTDRKAFLCDLHDVYLSELLKVGFAGYSEGTVTTSVKCQGDFLRSNASDDNFDTLTYECQNSTCNCPGCSPIVISIIGAVHSYMWLECRPDGSCEFWQKELLGGKKINLTCTGSECMKPGELVQPGPMPAVHDNGAYDDAAYCGADFFLWHDKYYSRPMTMDPVLSCHFQNCRKVVKHVEIPTPKPWVLSYVVVPVFLVIVAVIGLAVYFWRLTRRCEFWQEHAKEENFPTITVTCKRVSYSVQTGKELRRILEPVSCELQSGRTLAVMGASGAGKTTFLDIIAGRAKAGNISGSMKVNGERLATSQALHIYRRYICAYVMQDDCLPGYLTAGECVLYAASLRLPVGVLPAEKEKRVKQVMEELGLSHVMNTRVGSPNNRGISGGEMKRVSIAMQMVVNPAMLVLDEPTSGLDAYNAHQVMEHLLRSFQPTSAEGPSLPSSPDSDTEELDADVELKARLLKGPQTQRLPIVVFSIHQPSAKIFQLFDQLMLFSKGKVMYQGHAAQAVPYFESRGFSHSFNTNPADWLLFLSTTTTAADSPASQDPLLSASAIACSCVSVTQPDPSQNGMPQDIEVPNNDSMTRPSHAINTRPSKSVLRELQESMWYYPEFMEQMPVLFWRGFTGMKRNPLLFYAHFVVTLLLAIFVGFLYQHLDDCADQPKGLECQPDLTGIWNRAGGLFFLLAYLALASLSSIDSFQSERMLFIRERASGYYGTAAYLFPKLVLDFFPLRILPSLMLALIIYYKIPLGNNVSFGLGLRSGLTYISWFATIFCLFNLCAAGMCITISTLCPSPGLSALVSTLYILFLMVFGGIYIRMDSMPDGLKWLRYISFFSCSFELLMVNEINGREVLFNPVDVDGKHMYNVPQTGYLMLKNLGLMPTEAQWKLDACLLLGWMIAYILLACLFLRFLIRERR